ncbi:MAG: FMN-binding protein [Treponema sp.]|jgi:major membrane immunogen (membrane-anchored lipoprotein)|nr:FMN-binding protein [Treponema sp.]
MKKHSSLLRFALKTSKNRRSGDFLPLQQAARAPLVLFLGAALLIGALGGCGAPSYQDGVFSGKSSEDDTGAWGEVTLTIGEGKIRSCQFVTRQKDGTIKDENYGKVNGEISSQDFYDKAQLAVEAMKQYAAQYEETQSLKDLDAISGATIAYDQFIEAVENALGEAKK